MSNCPSLFELTESSELPPQLAAHVATCPRCAALRAAWDADAILDDELDDEDLPQAMWPHPTYRDVDAPPAAGAVHSIWGPESGELLTALIVDVDQAEALVVPVSPDVPLAGDWDILLGERTLPYAAMAQAWNHLHVLREQLMEQVASLRPTVAAGVTDAVDAFVSGEPLPSGLREGPELRTAEDPRHTFRDEESARVRDFTEPWRLLFSAPTLGGVLRSRREDCELELPMLSEDVDLDPASLTRLEQDQEDVYANVAPATMERLVRRLKLPPSVRLGELIGTAAFENVRQGPPETGAALARRRRGVRSGTPRPAEDLRRQLADQYVERLMLRLGR